MGSLVEVLWGLDLLLGRAHAVGAEFLLSGPVNLWLRGLYRGAPEARYVLLTSSDYREPLLRALSVGAVEEEPPADLERVVEGLAFHARLRGLQVTLLVDPLVESPAGRVRVSVAHEARRAAHALVGGRIVRLAPLGVEALLWGD